MKEYPSIPKEIQSVPIYAFDKLDGSNIRAEWSKKQGFYKFGRRHGLLDDSNPILKRAPEIIQDTSAELLRRFKEMRYEKVMCFYEFHGPNSFAGTHSESDTQRCSLIDINPFKKGILDPAEFLQLAEGLDHAALLYRGNANSDFVRSVEDGTLSGMTFEGVVCKAKNPKRTPMPLMFKVKNRAWLEKLKDYCKGDERLFQQLS